MGDSSDGNREGAASTEHEDQIRNSLSIETMGNSCGRDTAVKEPTIELSDDSDGAADLLLADLDGSARLAGQAELQLCGCTDLEAVGMMPGARAGSLEEGEKKMVPEQTGEQAVSCPLRRSTRPRVARQAAAGGECNPVHSCTLVNRHCK